MGGLEAVYRTELFEGNRRQPIAWRVPPILTAPDELLGVRGLAKRAAPGKILTV
jgi:hypothetical protein